MALIDSSDVFSTPEEIYLRDLLNLPMSPRTLQKVLVPFNDGELKEHAKKALNYLEFVKETPQNYYSQEQPINKWSSVR